MGGEYDAFQKLVLDQRAENKEQFAEQRRATTELVKSVSELSSILARSEERHLKHDDGVKRIDRVLEDHEARLRFSETRTNNAFGSWKAITVFGSIAAAFISFAVTYWGAK